MFCSSDILIPLENEYKSMKVMEQPIKSSLI